MSCATCGAPVLADRCDYCGNPTAGPNLMRTPQWLLPVGTLADLRVSGPPEGKFLRYDVGYDKAKPEPEMIRIKGKPLAEMCLLHNGPAGGEAFWPRYERLRQEQKDDEVIYWMLYPIVIGFLLIGTAMWIYEVLT